MNNRESYSLYITMRMNTACVVLLSHPHSAIAATTDPSTSGRKSRHQNRDRRRRRDLQETTNCFQTESFMTRR